MTAEKKAELLPCPFCGGDPKITNGLHVRNVFCPTCDAVGPTGNDAEGAERWNTRAPSPSSEMVEPREQELQTEMAKMPQSVADAMHSIALAGALTIEQIARQMDPRAFEPVSPDESRSNDYAYSERRKQKERALKTAERAYNAVKAALKAAGVSGVPEGHVMVPRSTLEWWTELARINPNDLPPRIGKYLAAAPER